MQADASRETNHLWAARNYQATVPGIVLVTLDRVRHGGILPNIEAKKGEKIAQMSVPNDSHVKKPVPFPVTRRP